MYVFVPSKIITNANTSSIHFYLDHIKVITMKICITFNQYFLFIIPRFCWGLKTLNYRLGSIKISCSWNNRKPELGTPMTLRWYIVAYIWLKCSSKSRMNVGNVVSGQRDIKTFHHKCNGHRASMTDMLHPELCLMRPVQCLIGNKCSNRLYTRLIFDCVVWENVCCYHGIPTTSALMIYTSTHLPLLSVT